MDGFFALLLVGVGVAVVAIIVLRVYQEQKRTEEMQVVAGRMGFSFAAGGEPSLQGRLGRFCLFSQGRSRKARNVLRQEVRGMGVTLFDYRYTTGSGEHNQTRDQTVALFETDRLHLPAFSLRPEGVFHKLAGSFGYQDIDFEAHPVFSEAYLLRGDDEARIRAAFRDEALGYLARYRDLCIEGDGQRLIFYRARRRVDPGMMEGFLQQGLEVVGLFLEEEEAVVSPPAMEEDLEEAQELDEMLAQLDLGELE
jgi:hypothetical protein